MEEIFGSCTDVSLAPPSDEEKELLQFLLSTFFFVVATMLLQFFPVLLFSRLTLLSILAAFVVFL